MLTDALESENLLPPEVFEAGLTLALAPEAVGGTALIDSTLRLNRLQLVRALGIPPSEAKRLTDELMQARPDFVFHDEPEDGPAQINFGAEGLHFVSAQVPPPLKWHDTRSLVSLGYDKDIVNTCIDSFLRRQPLWIRPHLVDGPEGTAYFAGGRTFVELTNMIQKETHAAQLRKLEAERAGKFEVFASTTEMPLTPEGFKELLELFGDESGADILLHHQKNRQKMSEGYVKSFLADYLGEFIVVKGELNFGLLSKYAEVLTNSSLKVALTEIIKRACLSDYNKSHRDDPTRDEFMVVAAYLDGVRDKMKDIENLNLRQILSDVENYYLRLFVDFKIPEKMISGLSSDRPFPDLNQKINVAEILDKKRLLLADDMGLGKSASAIFAKESCGSELAVIIAPKSVVEKRVWQHFLSDGIGADGKQVGYFKTGMAPRVLKVNGARSLQGIDKSKYDYIVVTQESIDVGITTALKATGFDMLIVDEAHKMKNLKSGVWARHLVELSESLEDRENTHLVLVTGTPVPNKLSDAAILLRLLCPDQMRQFTDIELIKHMVEGDLIDIRSLIVPKMQAKLLADWVDLPEVITITEMIDASPREVNTLEFIVENDEADFNTKIHTSRLALINAAALSIDPPLVPSKAIRINEQLPEIFEEKQKVLMFVNNYKERVLSGDQTILDHFDIPEDVTVRVIHGDVKERERMRIHREFQDEDKKILLLVNGQMADVGVDYSSADEIIFYNEGWTEAEKRQQIARAQRPGRTTQLVVREYVMRGTIEEGMRSYRARKELAVRKFMYGIPLTEIQKTMLQQDAEVPAAEVSPELANYYFSSMQLIERMFSKDKELGEPLFRSQVVKKSGAEYARIYRELTSRSYQSNLSRLSGTLIETFADEEGKTDPVILDLGSGPEMLRRHISDELADKVISLDINPHQFADAKRPKKAIVGSIFRLPLASASVDYVNNGIVLSASRFTPSQINKDPIAAERLEFFQELNRVLKPGGRAVITLIYSLDLADPALFEDAMAHMGFEVITEYSGLVKGGKQHRGRVITLQKIADCEEDTHTLVGKLRNAPQKADPGKKGVLSGLEFTKSKLRPKTPKIIDKIFSIDGGATVVPTFNAEDRKVVEEESQLLESMYGLRTTHKSIAKIPSEEIVAAGISRVLHNRRYFLFGKLLTASGAVFINDDF